MITKKHIICVLSVGAVLLSGCGSKGTESSDDTSTDIDSSASEVQVKTNLDKIDMTQWQYNEENICFSYWIYDRLICKLR